jgi:hypothetical protein
MEVPEAEWTSPAGKKAASRMNEASPPENTRPNPHTGSPAKKHKPTKETVREVPESEERLTVRCRLKAWTWTRVRTSAPDPNAPRTTEAEDAELLKQCAHVIGEDTDAAGNKPTVQKYADAVKEVARQIYVIYVYIRTTYNHS